MAATAAENLPRMLEHAYGFIVFVSGADNEFHEPKLKALREFGFSDALVDLYDRAASDENTIMLINFDADGPVIEGLPTFG